MVSKMESPPPLIGPRISFSSDGGDASFICITGKPVTEKDHHHVKTGSVKVTDFEFLSENISPQRMLSADELFSEGKLLPFWQVKHSENLKNITLMKPNQEPKTTTTTTTNQNPSWFIDEDPSPRPPKCTVLWKELLRLKKQRNSSSSSSSLSPSSSTSSSSSIEREEREKEAKRVGGGNKKGLERTKSSSSMRIRPMIHVPICTPSSKSSVPLPPLFPLKKNRVERRS